MVLQDLRRHMHNVFTPQQHRKALLQASQQHCKQQAAEQDGASTRLKRRVDMHELLANELSFLHH